MQKAPADCSAGAFDVVPGDQPSGWITITGAGGWAGAGAGVTVGAEAGVVGAVFSVVVEDEAVGAGVATRAAGASKRGAAVGAARRAAGAVT
ncbi:hypothetical protein, partial [Brevundimonas sp.]|uniref:hypothetical protein n=1 Tax=Brevundimonas sp. TaxID=1871086 RepID=UPI003563E655